MTWGRSRCAFSVWVSQCSPQTSQLGEACSYNADTRKNAVLCPKDLLELGDHLLKTSDDDYRILYVTSL